MNSHQRVIVITGASSGIGKSAAKALATQGWRIIGVGRNPDRCAKAEAELRAIAPGAQVNMIRADLSLMSDAARAADAVASLTDRIDVLINNAGGVGKERVMTTEGNEATFASNHLGPFLFTQRLLPLLRAAVPGSNPGAVRVIATSSKGHEGCPGMDWADLQHIQKFSSATAYMSAKLANILFTRALAKRLQNDGIVAHAMEPGIVLDSNFTSHADTAMQSYLATCTDVAVSSDEAAQTLVWLATAPEAGRSTGGYYYESKPRATSAAAQDDAAADRLWAESEALIARSGI